MLTKLTIRNFKQFGEVEIPLANGVVFVGPNNSGKTSALQALALWHAGLLKMSEKMWRGKFDKPIAGMSEEELLAEDELFDEIAPDSDSGNGKKPPSRAKARRQGVIVNRLELTSLPIPVLDMIWHERKTRRGAQLVRIDIIVEGVNLGRKWECGVEFDTGGGDSFYCRPLRLHEGKNPRRMLVPNLAYATKVAMLPPMSGLALEEPRFDEDKRVNALIGEGRTAEVLRNLCFRIFSAKNGGWDNLTESMRAMFGVSLREPFTNARGAFVLEYTERGGKTRLDLQFAGRGMQQILLLLAFLQLNPNSALLLDEPDAHLEILRQREIYQALLEAAEGQKSQIIAASHSEVLLGESMERKTGVFFPPLGKPHLFGSNQKSAALMSLKSVGYDQYYHAMTRGWVLYLEEATDLAILRAFARKIGHEAREFLDDVFVKYVCDATEFPNERASKQKLARRHFYALRNARPDFEGVLLVDSDVKLKTGAPLKEMQWRKREVENYLCSRQTLLNFAASGQGNAPAEEKLRRDAMEREISKLEEAANIRGESSPFDANTKASDEFLSPLFRNFAKSLQRPMELRKADFHKLVPFIPDDEVDPEIREKLDAICEIAKKAKPQTD